MHEDMKASLQECGLSSKEVDVYVALLELGPSSVQDVAEKSGVNRSTTYLTLEALARRGLISNVEQDKKTMVVPESPRWLLKQVEEELRRAEEKRGRLEDTLPHLMAMFGTEQKPRVRYFEGKEALRGIWQEVSMTAEPLWEFFAVDEALVALARDQQHEEERIQATKRVRGRVLMAIKPGVIPPYFDVRGIEVRVMDYQKEPFSGDMTITQGKVYFVTHRADGMGIIMESPEMVALARALYEAAWTCATPWTPPPDWKTL